MEKQPRITFKKLKGFPEPKEKIETEGFLDAAKEIVIVIESFGKLFTPVVNDMNGNIIKLSRAYNANKEKYYFIEDLIILNVNNDNCAANALLWLKRGLQLICAFFENILYDANNSDILKPHLQNAYERTLKPYHGFIVQNTIKIIYNWVPTRKELIGSGEAHAENMQILDKFLPSMRNNLDKIDKLLKKYKLDDPKKA